jgi:hydroxymethylglutaryl-CoA reductase (NADPH)
MGTVGGGTWLPTQKEALSLMGVFGGDDGKNGKKLAAIVGGVVLAGEISLLSALAEGTLSESHEQLARGRSV